MNARLGTLALTLALCFGSGHAQSGKFAGQVPVDVSLKQNLNSKNAKPGQEISATIQKPVTIDGTNIAKGSILLGHVVDATKHSKTTPNGSLTIVFDHLKPKVGDPVPIQASVYRIALSENQVLAAHHDTDMGMRGSGDELQTTSSVRQGIDGESHRTQGMQSAEGAPVQVVSAVPGVALSAVVSDDKSGIMTAQNSDVQLGVGLDMVVGVTMKH